MNCNELRTQLDDYARGTLDPARSRALEAHLEQCPSCAAYLERLEPPLSEQATLPPTVAPVQDLWPGVQARLAPRRGLRRRVSLPNWALAAAAIVLIAISSGVTALVLGGRPTPAPVARAETLTPLEGQYASAAAELGAELERVRTRLAPATVQVIERNLAVIDSALAETRRALAKDPNNAALERLVIAAWQQKMDFLRRATALSTES